MPQDSSFEWKSESQFLILDKNFLNTDLGFPRQTINLLPVEICHHLSSEPSIENLVQPDPV